MAKSGVYAGTFDPVHDGHMAFAMAALTCCRLDRVIFLPEPKPRGKHGVTSVVQRLEMLRLAIAGHSALQAHILPDEQFTVQNTLPRLQQLFGTDITLLVGSDVAQHISEWPMADELLAAVRIAVAQRQGEPEPQLLGATIVPTGHAHIAASRIRSGESWEVAPQVRQYIQNNRLYVV